ncbi:MAG: chorismate-binding protein, partial [Bdellovibrionales bacterium]|nr:chorismate-binding protein [Bdellovibrionales bacterium]NQZ17728.1 chorismate-binding protein [Bdellovibrionales bacterium]
MSLKNGDFNREKFLNKGAIFAFNNRVWLMWGDSKKQQDRPEHPSVSFNSFFLEKDPQWDLFEHTIETSNTSALQVLKTETDEENFIKWKAISSDSFEQQFDWIQNKFSKNEIQKVVPYVFEEGEYKIKNSKLILHALSAALNHTQGFLYGYWSETEGLLGLTPEVLIEQKDHYSFSTMAVAGTVSLEDYKKDPKSFVENTKENHEHDWVVKDIENVLTQVGEVNVRERQVVETPSLAHIKTSIDLKTNGSIDIEKLVQILHPTPALGVYPREKNRETLTYLNKVNERGSFGAPFGFSISKEEALFVVAIRNIQWKQNKISIGSGCGVVKES